MRRSMVVELSIVIVISLFTLSHCVRGIMPTQACQNGKIWWECASACRPKCDQPDPTFCILRCDVGCFCPPERPIEYENRCITRDECPAPACSGPGVTGPCRAAIPRWFYNTTAKQCQQFIYGGCDGSINNYESRNLCDAACNPNQSQRTTLAPRATATVSEACSGPGVTGPCRASMPRWFYNTTSRHCQQFIYGGCDGTANNYESRDLCNAACKPHRPHHHGSTPRVPAPAIAQSEACTAPAESGTCLAYMPQWFYNVTAKQCQQFVYGGCGGNANRYATREACNQACKHRPSTPLPSEACSGPGVTGPCRAAIRRWFYNTTSHHCEQFIYGGCDGNANNYQSRDQCNSACRPHRSSGVPRRTTPTPVASTASTDVCQLPHETGNCRASLQKWYYDARGHRCRQFTYGGCGGNGNRFDSRAQCQRACVARS